MVVDFPAIPAQGSSRRSYRTLADRQLQALRSSGENGLAVANQSFKSQHVDLKVAIAVALKREL